MDGWWLYCLIFILSLSLWVKKYYRKYKLVYSITTSNKSYPVIGIGYMFFGNTESIMKSLHDLSTETSEKGGLMNAWLGPVPYIMLTDITVIETILKYHLEKDDVYKFFQSATGNGSLFARVSEWKWRRRNMTSVLHPKYVSKFFDVFLNRSLLLCEKVYPETANKKPFGIWKCLNSYSFDVIWQISMGKGWFSIKEEKSYFLESLMLVKNYLSLRCFQFWLYLDVVFRFTPNYSLIEERKSVVYPFLDQTIEKKRQECNVDNAPYAIENLLKGTRMTVFELLLCFSKRDKEYNNLELREELLSLILAATDTTATAICFILKLLAKYPSVQEKVYEELCAAFQEQNMLPNSKDDLSKLEYTERVINETLRLYPPAPIILRKTNKEIMLNNGVILPENCSVLVSIWGVHRDKKYWGEDAEAFDPDRFLPERYSRVPPGSYIPFSSGPRNCPGYAYAMLSLKTAVSVILKTYKIVVDPENGPIPEMKVKFDVTLTPVDDTVVLEKRC